MNKIIRNASIELNNLDGNQVVKTAGVLQKIQNWLKSLTDPKFRDRINQLKNDSSQISVYLKNLDKYLKQIFVAIESGDVEKYTQVLEEIKYNASYLSKELDKLSETAENASIPEEYKKEEFPSGILKPQESIGIEGFILGEGFKRYAHQRFVKFLSSGSNAFLTTEEAEKVVQNPQFWEEFKKAVAAGKIIKTFERKLTGKEQQKNLAGDYIYYIQSNVFSVPNLPISLQVETSVVDQKYNKTIPGDRKVFQRIGNIIPVGEGPRAKARVKQQNVQNILLKSSEQTPWYLSLEGIKQQQVKFDRSNYVAPRKTTISKEEFINTLRSIWPKVIINIPVSDNGLNILYAQASLETGNFQSMYNYNFGNIKASPNSGKWTGYACGEKLNGKSYRFTEKHPMCYFRAFETPEDGMVFYLKTLSRKFGPALEAAASGNVEEFAYKLREQGYYTAEPAAYLKGLNRILGNEDTQEPENELRDLERALGISLTAMVVDIISNKVLPKNNINIKIKTGSILSDTEYAYILSNTISRTIDADTDICSNGKEVEINCSATGDIELIKEAVKSIDDVVSKAFLNKYKELVICRVSEGESKYNLIKEEKIDTIRRKFALGKLCHWSDIDWANYKKGNFRNKREV